MSAIAEDDPEARERAASLVGRTIEGRYTIDRVLATGAMGTVYLARHLKLKKRVAVKVLHPGVNDHPEMVMRFEREALAGAQMSHPHVAGASDFGDLDDGTRYLVMEYVKGSHLRDLIDREAPLDSERAIRIARQMAVALDYIHARGMVHRDIKPRNVMLETGDFVKIVDFGLAKIDGARLSTFSDDEAEEDSRLTTRGVIFGTVEYLAPEAAFGMELVDARADLYALGVIVYEMLAGKRPFDGKNDAEVFAKQRHQAPPPIAERAPGVEVSRDLEAIVDKLLAKDFDERYQTASELIAALDEAVPSASMAPPEPIEPPLPSAPNEPASERVEAETIEPEKPKLAKARRKKARSKKADAANVPEATAAKTSGAWKIVAAVAIAGGLLWIVWPRSPAAAPAAPAVAASSIPTGAASIASAPAPTALPANTLSAAASAPPAADPVAADRIRADMTKSFEDKRWDDGASALTELAKADPRLACDVAEKRTADALMAITRERAAHELEAWKAVAMSECGADRLYRFVENGGKAPWALRAAELLREPEVVAHASPAVAIAFALRDAPCDQKIAMLDRAVTDGDERALVVLDVVVRLCVRNPKALDAAIDKLRAKLQTATSSKKPARP